MIEQLYESLKNTMWMPLCVEGLRIQDGQVLQHTMDLLENIIIEKNC